MAVGDAHVFPGFLTPVLRQLFFPKPPTTFLACFCRGERRKYAGKKSHLNWGSNSQPPGHESDTFTTEPPGQVRIKLDYSMMNLFEQNDTKIHVNVPHNKILSSSLLQLIDQLNGCLTLYHIILTYNVLEKEGF